MSTELRPAASTNVPNVLIVGEKGVGKSSLVNLIAGEQLAQVCSVPDAGTLETTPYDTVLRDQQGVGHHIRLFDTVGIDEPYFRKTDYLSAIEKANTLICHLLWTARIHLLLFCVRAGRITATTQSTYRLFCDILCQHQVPVALVVTGLEDEDDMEGWWQKNGSLLEARGFRCASHVCATATLGRNNRYMEEYNTSQAAVREILLAQVMGNDTSSQPQRTGWSLAVKLLRLLRGKQAEVEAETARRLQDQCNLTRSDAKQLALRICAKRLAYTSRPFNVALFGEMGAGKSSVVNLIAGMDIAKTSDNLQQCTRAPKPYPITPQGDHLLRVWDTPCLVKLEEPLSPFSVAIKRDKLLGTAKQSGGLHLALLCINGTGTRSPPKAFKALIRALEREKVPLCVVVTHLEREQNMDSRWPAHKDQLSGYGITIDDHACITAIPATGDNETHRRNYEESRQKIHELLLESRRQLSVS